jgi:hypothetical protein
MMSPRFYGDVPSMLTNRWLPTTKEVAPAEFWLSSDDGLIMTAFVPNIKVQYRSQEDNQLESCLI